MKTGRSIVELAQEIARQAEEKKDYLVSTNAMVMEPLQPTEQLAAEAPKPMQIVIAGGTEMETRLDINGLAHEQIASYLDIPRKYYDRCRTEQPELLAENVNRWMRYGKQEVRQIRSLDGRARAFLSNAYRPLDNESLAEAVLPVLGSMELEMLSCEVTERRLYLKAVDKRISLDIPTGRRMGDGSHIFFDTISPAIIISNSEVGCGALAVETGVWTKVCTNMAISSQRSMRKYHVGSRADLGEEVMAMLSESTRRLTDAALWAQVRDVVSGAFDRARLEAYAKETLLPATEAQITGDPVKVVEVMAKKNGLQEAERTSVLRHLISGGDLTQYGLHAAVTRAAEDLPDYDRATEFERLGTKVIELPRSEWQVLAAAA
jgi:hypothetical protein